MDNGSRYISSIFNYCDRWCERCEFTTRCAVYADERSFSDPGSDDPIGDALRTVAATFSEVSEMLHERAEEMGIDLGSAINDPEILQGIERRRERTADSDAVRLAQAYAIESRELFARAGEWLPDDDEMAGEMFEILQWYSIFISAKIVRGYRGIVDHDGNDDAEQLRDTQSDANGSIKIALIAIERSILAWTYLHGPTNRHIIAPEIKRLESIGTLLDEKFPNARDFIRPGFDEIETVM